jgi:hypothetical protein
MVLGGTCNPTKLGSLHALLFIHALFGIHIFCFFFNIHVFVLKSLEYYHKKKCTILVDLLPDRNKPRG